jgi:hypothetical protein
MIQDDSAAPLLMTMMQPGRPASAYQTRDRNTAGAGEVGGGANQLIWQQDHGGGDVSRWCVHFLS